MEHIITVSGLKKSFGNVHAVDGIDFSVEKGKLFAFLGPNGAGKSTTVNILCTALRPDEGDVTVNGFTLGRQDDDIRRSIGVVFQSGYLDHLLTVRENLLIRGSLYGLSGSALKKAVEQAAEQAMATEFFHRPYGSLSGGQKRRADIARALVNTPQILFLDEPTTGLDPQTRHHIWNTISSLQSEKGVTVFLTTHYMEEAARADYVVILDHGKVAAQGTPAELIDRYASDCLKITAADHEALASLLDVQAVRYTYDGGRFVIRLASSLDALPILQQYSHLVAGFEVLNGTMDDAFISITGKEIRA